MGTRTTNPELDNPLNLILAGVDVYIPPGKKLPVNDESGLRASLFC